MHEAEKYNGWRNRETWLANLWLNNDEGSYTLLQEALDTDTFQDYEKAEWLEEKLQYQLLYEIEVPCMWQDLLRTAFGRINWQELIEKNIE